MSNTKIKAGQFSGIVGHGTDGYFLMTNGDGTMAWEAASTGPSVTSVSYPGDDLAADPTGGQTVVLTGTNFGSSMTVSIGGTTAPSVAHDSSTQLTITTPAKAAGDYDIVVTNTVTGASGTFVNGISYNGIPSWTTAAGSLGTFESQTTISTITLQATEPDGGTITFNITNGALPTGLSLTGANIDGTTTAESSTTLYSFTIEAIDDENQATPRNFSITVNAAALTPSENFTINIYTGNGSTRSIEGKIGTAAQFNGISSEVEVSSNVLNINTISISAWINLSTTSGFQQIVSNYSSLNTGWGLRVNDGGYLAYTTGVGVIASSTALSANTWYHVALTIDSSGNSTKLYINGSEDSSTTYTAATYGAGNTNFHIGSLGNVNVQYFNGSIDQVRIFNKALSTDNNGVNEITTLYSENNASSTKSTTDIFGDGSGVALYEFEEGAKDTGGVNGYIGAAGVFNGSSKIDITGFQNFGSTGVSISAWVNVDSFSNGPTIVNLYSNNSIVFGTDTSGNFFRAGQGTTVTSTSSMSTGTWHHVVMSAQSNGDVNLYLDGQPAGSGSCTTAMYADNNVSDLIGAYGTLSQPMNGKIDQIRIFDKAISSSEVTTLYQETSASATKSTTDIFDDGSGIALYELEGNANDTGVYPFLGTVLKANNSPSNSQGSKVGWFRSDNLPAFNNASALSIWIKPSAIGFCGIYSQGNNASNSAMRMIINSSGNLELIRSGGYTLASSLSPNVGKWNHVVFNFNNQTTSFDVWLNGTKETVTGTFNYGSSPTEKIFGAFYDSNYGGTGAANGSIQFDLDHIRVYGAFLSDADIANLYAEDNVRTSNLTAFYKLENTVLDETGNYNATSSSAIYGDANYDGTATNVSYAYDGTPTNVSFVGTSFQPDLVWIKSRTDVRTHSLLDSVRGASKIIQSESTTAEWDGSAYFDSFNSNGFTVKSNENFINNSSHDYVAWCWKAEGSVTPNNNTNGTITSTVSANQDAGFSIVKYTGTGGTNGQTESIGHGLSTAPELIIVKNTDSAYNWVVRVEGVTSNSQILQLNLADGVGTPSQTPWGTPTNSTFLVGRSSLNVNENNSEMIAYCFHSVDGYQKVGTYSGSNSPITITTGFKPRFLMVKRTNASGGWIIIDSARGDGSNALALFPNENYADSNNWNTAFTSTGFTISSNEAWISVNGGTYIYLAIA